MPRTQLYLPQVQAGFQCGSAGPDPHSPSSFGLSARSAKHIRFLLLMGTPHPEPFPHCPHAYPPTSVYRICLFMLKAYWGTGSTCFSPRGNKRIHSPRKISMHKDVSHSREHSNNISVTYPAKPREQAFLGGGRRWGVRLSCLFAFCLIFIVALLRTMVKHLTCIISFNPPNSFLTAPWLLLLGR